MPALIQAIITRTADALAREHTEEAIERLVSVMRDAEKDSDVLKAASELLDRGHGKPLAATIQIPVSRRLASQLYAMSDEELMAIATSQPKAVTDQSQDAEFVEAPAPPRSAEPFDFEAACATLPKYPRPVKEYPGVDSGDDPLLL